MEHQFLHFLTLGTENLKDVPPKVASNGLKPCKRRVFTCCSRAVVVCPPRHVQMVSNGVGRRGMIVWTKKYVRILFSVPPELMARCVHGTPYGFTCRSLNSHVLPSVHVSTSSVMTLEHQFLHFLILGTENLKVVPPKVASNSLKPFKRRAVTCCSRAVVFCPPRQLPLANGSVTI